MSENPYVRFKDDFSFFKTDDPEIGEQYITVNRLIEYMAQGKIYFNVITKEKKKAIESKETQKLVSELFEGLGKRNDKEITFEEQKQFFTSLIEEVIEIRKQKESGDFLPIQQHDGLMDVLFNLGDFKKTAQKDRTETTAIKKTKKGEIVVKSDDEMTLDELMKNLSDSQLQLILYCIYQKGIQGPADKIEFDIKEYCEIKGISKETNNVKKLKEDFKTLQNTYITFTANVKGKQTPAHYSRILAITDIYTRRNTIKFTFGAWADTLSKNQYALISKTFFQHKGSRRNLHTIRLSLKLHIMVRNNYSKNKNGNYALKVSNIIDLLGFNENTITAKGFLRACKDPVDNALDEVAEKDGFKWHYRKDNHNTFKEYKADYIEFSYPRLEKAYNGNK